MKKTVTAAIAVIFCVNIFIVSVSCAASYNWYCRHVENGAQPPIDPDMSFIEKYDGYYLDRSSDDNDKKIYLTFDAGYENGNVEKILDTLKEKNVCGSFFILENLVKRNTELVKRMHDDGHLVCNHTAVHRDMTKVSVESDFISELDRLNDSVKEYCGFAPAKFYRPPEGRFNEDNLKWASDAGYKTVFWSFAYADWDNEKQPDPSFAMNKILSGAHPGEILLLHPTSATNAAILPELIDRLTESGYRFCTLDELPEIGE